MYKYNEMMLSSICHCFCLHVPKLKEEDKSLFILWGLYFKETKSYASFHFFPSGGEAHIFI